MEINTIIHGDCIDVMNQWEDSCVDMVFTSPPYEDARAYSKIKGEDWVNWMESCVRVFLDKCKGPVLIVVSSLGNYSAVSEGLVWKLRDFALRPCIWTKNAPPTGHKWFSNEWEYVLAFSKHKPVPYWNTTPLATPLKYKSGGTFRQRGKDSKRKMGSAYPKHTHRKRPGNVFYVTVGGGHMGSPLACKHSAPFPEKLVEKFLPVLCPPGGIVVDPFCGSGTTCAVAKKSGRQYIGIDNDQESVDLSNERLGDA